MERQSAAATLDLLSSFKTQVIIQKIIIVRKNFNRPNPKSSVHQQKNSFFFKDLLRGINEINIISKLKIRRKKCSFFIVTSSSVKIICSKLNAIYSIFKGIIICEGPMTINCYLNFFVNVKGSVTCILSSPPKI